MRPGSWLFICIVAVLSRRSGSLPKTGSYQPRVSNTASLVPLRVDRRHSVLSPRVKMLGVAPRQLNIQTVVYFLKRRIVLIETSLSRSHLSSLLTGSQGQSDLSFW